MQQSTRVFLQTFLAPPEGKSPQDIKARLLHWIEVANSPEQFTGDPSAHTLAAKRRSARQNVKRLAERHPEIAAQLMHDRVHEQEAE